MITLYEEKIKQMGEEIALLFIDNYSNVSYLITTGGKLIPIVPESIPFYKHYKCIYSFTGFFKVK